MQVWKKKFWAESHCLFLFLSLFFQPFFFSPILRPASFKMGTGKKEATRRVRQGKTGDGMANVHVKGENFYR